MLYFHQNSQSHAIKNYVLTPQYFVLPKQSGVLATEEDVTDNTLISMVEKPIITFPANNSVDYNNNINFTSYKRNPLYSGDKTHMSIQVAYDISFTNLYSNVKVSDTDINLATRYLPVDVSSATVYIRIKYHSGLYSSPWSDPIKVTTKKFEIGTPKILTPTDGARGISKNIVISTSAFTYVGVSDTHDSTTYQVAQDIYFNTILLNTTETTNLTSYIAAMAEGKTYYIRVRHNGTKYGSSNWSSVVKVSTLVPVSSHSFSGRLHTGANKCGARVRYSVSIRGFSSTPATSVSVSGGATSTTGNIGGCEYISYTTSSSSIDFIGHASGKDWIKKNYNFTIRYRDSSGNIVHTAYLTGTIHISK